MNAKIEVELQGWMGGDTEIANAAWTSTYDKSKREDRYDDPEKVASIVERLIIDGHATPVESVVFRFWIRHPILCDRQHMTHRIASHNGLSGRYRTLPSDWYSVPEDVRAIADKVAPGAGRKIGVNFDTEMRRQYAAYSTWLGFLKEGEKSGAISNTEYKRAREILRGVLGTSFMVERTSIFNLRSFANYYRLRQPNGHAQPEIGSVAQQMLDHVERENICPVAIATLKRIGWKI